MVHVLLLILALFSTCASAESNGTFVNPPYKVDYTIRLNSSFLVQWQADYPVTLILWAGPEGGPFTSQTLADNISQTYNSFLWIAGPVPQVDLQYPMHFAIIDSSDSKQSFNSHRFYVSPDGDEYPPITVTSSTVPSSTTTTDSTGATSATFTESTSSDWSRPSSTAASESTPASTSIINPSSGSQERQNLLSVGLGTGLGLGIPLLALVLSFGAIIYRRRQRTRVNSPQPPTMPYHGPAELKEDTTILFPRFPLELHTERDPAEMDATTVAHQWPEPRHELKGS